MTDSQKIVAIDGVSASGKGTLARRLARVLGWHYLDTGALYRAMAFLMGPIDPDEGLEEQKIPSILNVITPQTLQDPALRTEEIARRASQLAVNPSLRKALLSYQRWWANRSPGAVLDGRDIGTVVVPQSPLKLFVVAGVNERARRRWREYVEQGDRKEAPEYADILRQMIERDKRDRTRLQAPLLRADGAVVVDTTLATPEQLTQAVVCLVRMIWPDDQSQDLR